MAVISHSAREWPPIAGFALAGAAGVVFWGIVALLML